MYKLNYLLLSEYKVLSYNKWNQMKFFVKFGHIDI